MAYKKKKSSRKTSRKTSKKRTTKKRSATGLKKKFRKQLAPTMLKKNSKARMQPKRSQARSDLPASDLRQAIVEYKKQSTMTPDKQDKKRESKFKSALKKSKKFVSDHDQFIKDTVKWADSIGAAAERFAPTLTAMSVESGGMNPLLDAGAMMVDGVAGLHATAHSVGALIKDTTEKVKKGRDPGYKALATSGKYQKLMSEVREEDDRDTLMLMEAPKKGMNQPIPLVEPIPWGWDDL